MVGFFVSSILTSAVLARLLTLVGAFISDGPANVARGGRILTDSRGLIWREHHINIPIIEQVRGERQTSMPCAVILPTFLAYSFPLLLSVARTNSLEGHMSPPS